MTKHKMSIRLKIHSITALLGVIFFVVGGALVGSAYTSIRDEMYHWFDVSGQNLATGLARNTVEFVFPYYEETLDDFILQKVQEDPVLLYFRVDFEDEEDWTYRDAGEADAGNYHEFTYTIADNDNTPISTATIHYSTGPIESKLFKLAIFIPAIALGGFLIFIFILDAFMVRYVTRPMMKLVNTSQLVSDGDLSQEVRVETGDEVEVLCDSFSQMTRNLRTIVERIIGVAGELGRMSGQTEEVAGSLTDHTALQVKLLGDATAAIEQMDEMIKTTALSVESLFESIGQSASSTVEMSTSIGQVSSTSEILAQSMDTYAASIEQLAVSIGTVAQGVNNLDDQVASTSEEIEKIDQSLHAMNLSAARSKELTGKLTEMVTNEGQQAARRATDGFGKIQSVVEEAVETMGELSAQAEGIGSVIDIISDLAEQTNLLSLNAAIIAAQAGDHGRSFAVVADEIRELAERTSSYLEEISVNIRGVQRQATSATTIITKGSKVVDEGVGLIGAVDRTLKQTAADANEASRAVELIAEAIAVSAESTEKITTAARHMAKMSSEINTASTEQSEGTRQMLDDISRVRIMSMEVNQAMREQQNAALIVSTSAEAMRELAERIRNATLAETANSARVVATIEELEQASLVTNEAVTTLDETVKRVNADSNALMELVKRFRT